MKFNLIGVLTTLFSICLMFGFAMLVMAIFIEFAAGCGESFVTASGERVMGQCIFLTTKG